MKKAAHPAAKAARALLEARQAAEKYAQLFDFASVACFMLHPLGVVQEVNLAGADLLGIDRENVIGRPFETYVAPECRAALAEFWQSLRPGAGRRLCETRLLQRDHGTRDVLVEAAPFQSDQQGCLLAVTDITARKQAERELERPRRHLEELVQTRTAELEQELAERRRAEAELRASEQFSLAVLDSLPAHIAVLDRSGMIVSVNARWQQFARANNARSDCTVAVGASYLEVCRRAGQQGDSVALAVLSGIQAVFNGDQPEFLIEYPCHSPERERWFLLQVTPILPAVERVILSHLDITARRQAEAALRLSQEDLDRAQKVGQIGSWRLDTRRNILTWSDENHRIFGVPKGTLLTYESFLSIVHPDDRLYVDTQWQAGLRGDPYDIEHRLVVHGQVKWVREKAYLEFDESGALLGGFGITQDVTALKQAGAERQKFVSLADHSAEFIGMCDLDFKPFYVNEAGRRLVGLDSLAQALAVRVQDFFFPEDQALITHEFFPKVLREGHAEVEVRFRHFKTGAALWMIYNVLGIQDEAGCTVGYATVSRDITARKEAEEALRASEERFRGLVEQAPDGIFLADAQGHYVDVNSAGAEILGYTREEICRLGITDVVAPEEEERLPEEVARLAGGTVVRSEWRFKRKDGSIVIGEVVGRQLPDGQLQGILRDITVRRQAEEKLRESESFYRQTLESIPGMVFTTRPDGYCDYQSQQWEEFTGVPMREHVGDGWNNLLHPDDRPRAFAAWRAAVEERAPYDLEYRVRRYDGEYEWFKVQARPIRNAAGEIVRWFGTALNIHDLIKARAALERSERLYRAIGESNDYGIWVCEPDGRNTYASESFLKLVGITQEQYSSFGWGEMLHPEDIEHTVAAWNECVRTGGNWDREHRFRGVDGQWHPILARGVAVLNEDGRVLCWAGINLDISRLKHTEEQLRASLQEKEVLLKEIHHRVKNNLQVISSLINLQADTLSQPVLRDSLGEVRDRVRAMALVHEKLYQSANLAQLNFAEYAASLLQTLWRAHAKSDATIHLKLEMERVDLPVDTAIPCGLILNELASNALKHAFRGRSEGEVTVGLTCDAITGQVCLRVRDNGVGLPSDRDWRKSPSLGLRLVQMLSQQLHGAVEAGPGVGADFRVTFAAPQSGVIAQQQSIAGRQADAGR